MKTERKTKGYVEHEVVSQLSKKADIRISGKQIQELSEGKGDVGNGSKGKIDFLVKYCGYTHFYVKNFRS
jgi:hypothetical protein